MNYIWDTYIKSWSIYEYKKFHTFFQQWNTVFRLSSRFQKWLPGLCRRKLQIFKTNKTQNLNKMQHPNQSSPLFHHTVSPLHSILVSTIYAYFISDSPKEKRKKENDGSWILNF